MEVECAIDEADIVDDFVDPSGHASVISEASCIPVEGLNHNWVVDDDGQKGGLGVDLQILVVQRGRGPVVLLF